MPVRWIEDIPIEEARPLIGGHFLHPTGTTVLYGSGGIGKGLIGAYTARQLAIEGTKTLIIDAEQREQEWRTRIGDDLPKSIAYLDPDEDIAAIRHEVIEIISDLQIGMVIVDSASRAQPEPLKGQGDGSVARKMFAILKSFLVPALLIAHVPKSSQRDGQEPKHVGNPIGSVQYTNQARLTWSAIPVESMGNITRVETRCMKVNDRPRPLVRLWTFDHEAQTANVVRRGKAGPNLSAEIWRLLDKTGRVMTPAMIAVELRGAFPTTYDTVTTEQISNLLYRRREDRNSPLFRKVHGGWVNIRNALLSERFEDW